MAKSIWKGRWVGIITTAALFCGLLAGCASPSTPPADTSQTGDVAALKGQVAALQTSVAGLQTRVAGQQPQTAIDPQAAAQATRIAALEARVAALVPTATNTPLPTATIIPAVAGLVIDGNTKGAAGAKVTITEFVDYF